MSTRSYIGIKNSDGTVKAIYHHWDGYIEGGVGETLFIHYQDPQKIKKLINLGDMSSIGTEPIGYWGEDKNWGDTDYTKCKTYRARGEKGTSAKKYKDEKTFLEECEEDYTYLYKDGKWFVRHWDEELEPLENYF